MTWKSGIWKEYKKSGEKQAFVKSEEISPYSMLAMTAQYS